MEITHKLLDAYTRRLKRFVYGCNNDMLLLLLSLLLLLEKEEERALVAVV